MPISIQENVYNEEFKKIADSIVARRLFGDAVVVEFEACEKDEQYVREKKAMEERKVKFGVWEAISKIREGKRVAVGADDNPEGYAAEYYLSKQGFREWSKEYGKVAHEFIVNTETLSEAIYYEVPERHYLKDVLDHLASGGWIRNTVSGELVKIECGTFCVRQTSPFIRNFADVPVMAFGVTALTERVWVKE